MRFPRCGDCDWQVLTVDGYRLEFLLEDTRHTWSSPLSRWAAQLTCEPNNPTKTRPRFPTPTQPHSMPPIRTQSRQKLVEREGLQLLFKLKK